MMFRLFIFCISLALSMPAYADNEANLQQSIANLAVDVDIAPVTKVELDAFYASRGYKPVWDTADEEAYRKTESFLNSVDALIAYHGLVRENYHLDALRQRLAGKTEDNAEKQKLEFLITATLLHLAYDLHGEVTRLDTLYTGWNFHRDSADIPALVSAAIGKDGIADLFDTLPPQNKAYRDLASSLQLYRAIEAKGGWPAVASGGKLQAHDRDPRLVELRARLNAEGYETTPTSDGPDFFDEGLRKALIAYQTRNGLSPDGHLGAKTVEALSIPVDMRITQIRANMERWRHMPDDFPPSRYALVNIPDFSLTIVEDDKLLYRGIVIDGKTDRPTPFIASKIINMLVNPSWHVPLSIARKDILPKLRKDPHYLEKLDFVIAGRERDPTGATIDWKHMKDEDFNYQLRQNPGDLNSLGQLKFNFSNTFDVYMHGTPHQELFGKAERDFSSGCVRLEDPVRVGEILLAHNKDKNPWDEQHINDAIDSGQTQWVALASPMRVFFLYWSVFADENGQPNFRKDIYGYDTQLMDAMKGQAAPH